MPSEPVPVTDPDDPRLSDFRDLSRADRRPDRPGGQGLVIAEGVVVVRRMLASPYPVRALLGVQRRYDELAEDLAGVSAPFYVTSAQVMAQVVGFHLNRGVLATADRVPQAGVDELAGRGESLVVLEGVGDHENLGSVFRNAAALGLSGVVVGPGCADPLYRRSIRVSMGTALLVPFATSDVPLPELFDVLRGKGFHVVALTPRADAVPLSRAGLAGRKVAVVLGSEGPGLTEAALAAADQSVRIPMATGIDSLNVATAGAIAFAELTR